MGNPGWLARSWSCIGGCPASSVSSSGTVTGMPVEIDRQAAAVIDALAAVGSRRPSMTRTIRNCQLAGGPRDRRACRQPGRSRDRLGDGTSEAQLVRVRLAAETSRKEPDVAGKKRTKSLAQTEKKAPAKPKRPKRLRAASRQVVNGPLEEPPIVALASGGSACQHRGERAGAFRVGGSFPAP